MKKITYAVPFLIVLAFAFIPFGFYKIYYTGNFSTTNSDWGAFGSFIGGTSGALLSTFSLIVLIYTLIFTILNAEAQASIQQSFHESQMNRQQEHHNEQIKLQEEIHKQEKAVARFTLGQQMLKEFISILNNRLSKISYVLYSEVAGSYIKYDEKTAMAFLISKLNAILETSPELGENAFYETIDKLELIYSEELYSLSSILMIISSEPDENLRDNYISIFIASTDREPLFWLTAYAATVSSGIKQTISDIPLTFIKPPRVEQIMKKHGVWG